MTNIISFVFSKEGQEFAKKHNIEFYLTKFFTLKEEVMELPVNYNTIHYSVRKLVREEYVKKQMGLCHHCNALLSGEPAERITKKPVNKNLFPKGFFKWPVHLHHCHVTGMTIGAVHNYCNAVLWQYHGE